MRRRVLQLLALAAATESIVWYVTKLYHLLHRLSYPSLFHSSLTSSHNNFSNANSMLCGWYSCSLELAEQQLTNITSSGGNSTLSFTFYSGDDLVTTVSSSALAQETSLNLQNNSLTSVPASLFQAAKNAMYMSVQYCTAVIFAVSLCVCFFALQKWKSC